MLSRAADLTMRCATVCACRWLYNNQLTSIPTQLGDLTALQHLWVTASGTVAGTHAWLRRAGVGVLQVCSQGALT